MEFEHNLALGSFYHYIVGDLSGEVLFIEGTVVFNDGVSAIIKVTNRYEECFSEVLNYSEVKEFFPSFRDPEARRLTEYLCLDVETEYNLFFRDPNDDIIMLRHFDENGKFSFIPADIFKFRMDRIKKYLIYELSKEEEKQKQSNYSGPHINIDLMSSVIDNMFNTYDEDRGNDENVLNRSLNRSIHWLNNCSCAILSAWRGKYSRKENDDRNQSLQQTLRGWGYGVIRVKGCYAEIGRPLEKENSFLVFNLDETPDFRDKIYVQSEFYEQDCFLYKPVEKNNAYLIGTNDDFGKGKIEEAGVLRINSSDSEKFSEVGSGRVSFEKESK